ncbi:hypothetical protein L195_g036633, partial [Trifolium pratense]
MNTSEFDGNAAFAGGMPSQITQGADDSTSKELIVNVTKDTVKSRRESSATLISGLCNLYNPESKKFVMNNNASLSFCIREVADVL